MLTRLFSMLLLSAMLSSTAMAAPPPADAADGSESGGSEMSRDRRAQVLKKIHTGFILELGELLELDTTGTVKLSERLKKFHDQRIQLRLDTGDAMEALRKIAKQGTNPAEAPALARKIAQNRIQLAQLDQQEMEEIIKGLPPEKVAKVAVFMAEYPRRVEHLARELQRERGGRGKGHHHD